MTKVLVSACLLGEPVRYDGAHCRQDGLLALWQRQGRVIPFCPEVAGGLPVPRPPAEIEHGDAAAVLDGTASIRTVDGRDVSDAFVRGAEQALAVCRQHGIRIAVLKEGSPSCGSRWVNDGSFTGRKVRGQGLTSHMLSRNGVYVFSEAQLVAAARKLAELEGEHC